MPKRSRATSIFLDLYKLTPTQADLRSLGAIADRFAELPWENLTKFIKKHGARAATEKLRGSDEVLVDHARMGTGGTCFSLTNALRSIVTDLGYTAHPVMADMTHGENVHCALLVQLNGRRYLLDPGYLVAEPVPLDTGAPVRVRQAGSELEYVALHDKGEYELHTRNDRGEEVFRYRLRTDPVREEEFAEHWIASFDSTGMNGLHLNRISGDGRLSAHDLNLRVDNGREKRNVKLRDGYAEKVAEHFSIDAALARQAFDCWEKSRCRSR